MKSLWNKISIGFLITTIYHVHLGCSKYLRKMVLKLWSNNFSWSNISQQFIFLYTFFDNFERWRSGNKCLLYCFFENPYFSNQLMFLAKRAKKVYFLLWHYLEFDKKKVLEKPEGNYLLLECWRFDRVKVTALWENRVGLMLLKES